MTEALERGKDMRSRALQAKMVSCSSFPRLPSIYIHKRGFTCGLRKQSRDPEHGEGGERPVLRDVCENRQGACDGRARGDRRSISMSAHSLPPSLLAPHLIPAQVFPGYKSPTSRPCP